MFKKGNYCNSCPECICCGLNEDVIISVCDLCENEISEFAYKVNGETLCRKCAIEYIEDNADEFLGYLETVEIEE